MNRFTRLFSRKPDPVQEFARMGRNTLAGIRSAAAGVLREEHNFNFSPSIRDAILFGPVDQSFSKGDEAQITGPDSSANLRDVDSYIYKSQVILVPPITGAVLYRPSVPEQLHGITISHGAVIPAPLVLGMGPAMDTGPLRDVLSGIIVNSTFEPAVAFYIPFGRKGPVITPENPLRGLSIDISWRLVYQLSRAQISR